MFQGDRLWPTAIEKGHRTDRGAAQTREAASKPDSSIKATNGHLAAIVVKFGALLTDCGPQMAEAPLAVSGYAHRTGWLDRVRVGKSRTGKRASEIVTLSRI
jgi:hypothetical protein